MGSFPKDPNHTFITLIPNKYMVVKVADFRPISLYNVLYILVAKVIANRLKVILPTVTLNRKLLLFFGGK